MAETKGFGTTNVLVISKLGAVLGADSRITSYENEILSETSKCGVLYSDGVGSTHALWSWAGDQVEAVQFIENLEQAVAIMSNNNKIRATIETTAATELNKTYFKQGVQSFILTFESKTLVAYRCYVYFDHLSGCPSIHGRKCRCKPKRTSGMKKLIPGVYTLGSGSDDAIEHLATSFKTNLDSIQPDEEVGWMLEGFNISEGLDSVQR
ncbi:unnamed protein product [Cuscuta campestris]|uniref:Uncharacterized protein n=1 Tax=Cuscuta campestris TaxID=132261 RepID=A0A484LQ25_9ASTE|nr:unnamed protein product [Cuscuta campestris]VFQ78046.1 unnamed protein product [Cuscuta campestris]